MAELKTQPNNASVQRFLQAVGNDSKRRDCEEILAIMAKITGRRPVMWGASIVGFGRYKYTNTCGGGEWMLTGFSPRKQNLTIYIMNGFSRYADLMAGLGKFKTGKSCLYINKLDDIDLDGLKELITCSVADMRSHYECD